ncbi:hypothetical protein [Kitasatospora kifunensis]|uniref:Uncharacterized protein n=1 Tax=Kitasatospora kifunensis TaxID=58351 RepID=A0A7W7VUU7_KITKI|nr:hypothetical protein [Kitasatospora kifunensis]MBB4923009.1 hypothetical protein [Kitasatospora kifunensis]
MTTDTRARSGPYAPGVDAPRTAKSRPHTKTGAWARSEPWPRAEAGAGAGPGTPTTTEHPQGDT